MEDIFYTLHSRVPKSIEFPPIRKWDTLYEAINLFKEYRLDRYFKICNLPQNPLGIPSSDTAIPASYISKELDVHVINHLPYRTESITTYVSKLIEYSLARIEGLLLISGDIKISDITFEEATRLARSFRDGYVEVDGRRIEVERWRFAIGAGLLPNRVGEVEYFLSKVRAGAEFFQTQITLEEGKLARLIEEASGMLDNEIAVLVGVIPNKEGMEYIISKIVGERGIRPLELSQDRYIDHIEDILKKLLEISDRTSTINMGIHIYPIRWRRENIESVLELISRF